MTVLLHWLLLASAATTSIVTAMGDRWAWGFTDWSLRADRKIDTDETIDAFVPDEEEELLREPRKVEKDVEPRNFIKDKLCAIGLADVSIVL